MRVGFVHIMCLALYFVAPPLAMADEAGDGESKDEGGPDASDEGGDASDDGAASVDAGVPIACDAALCSTANSSGCDVAQRPIGNTRVDSSVAALIAALAIGKMRRIRTGAHRPLPESMPR